MKGKRSATHEEQTNNKASQKNAAEIETDNDDWSQKLESLGSTLDGDLSVLSSEDALSLVDEWHDLLHKAKEPEIKEIATHLKQLKQLLKSNKATGHEISEVLMEVGEQTANLASDADKEIKTPIRQLGKKISKIGNS
ncbi:hypothetical protein FNW02_35700 [Komarekiella sp. 'clone 1']|uniref:Uncharacterized protein n=1 Tax=Komarekiella delphini-convector SJRDD-AB1 TaxID=2593771 RepID=A0AA40T5F3_9NOST|nr:hypothetical protein [Komarekiella delphini-convector]MBD6620932.1 hypothetical protein [Komarekiella delphini-convector SJRDD-AB1]